MGWSLFSLPMALAVEDTCALVPAGARGKRSGSASKAGSWYNSVRRATRRVQNMTHRAFMFLREELAEWQRELNDVAPAAGPLQQDLFAQASATKGCQVAKRTVGVIFAIRLALGGRVSLLRGTLAVIVTGHLAEVLAAALSLTFAIRLTAAQFIAEVVGHVSGLCGTLGVRAVSDLVTAVIVNAFGEGWLASLLSGVLKAALAGIICVLAVSLVALTACAGAASASCAAEDKRKVARQAPSSPPGNPAGGAGGRSLREKALGWAKDRFLRAAEGLPMAGVAMRLMGLRTGGEEEQAAHDGLRDCGAGVTRAPSSSGGAPSGSRAASTGVPALGGAPSCADGGGSADTAGGCGGGNGTRDSGYTAVEARHRHARQAQRVSSPASAVSASDRAAAPLATPICSGAPVSSSVTPGSLSPSSPPGHGAPAPNVGPAPPGDASADDARPSPATDDARTTGLTCGAPGGAAILRLPLPPTSTVAASYHGPVGASWTAADIDLLSRSTESVASIRLPTGGEPVTGWGVDTVALAELAFSAICRGGHSLMARVVGKALQTESNTQARIAALRREGEGLLSASRSHGFTRRPGGEMTTEQSAIREAVQAAAKLKVKDCKAALLGRQEHRVLAATHLAQLIAEHGEEIGVGVDDGSVELELDHRLAAGDAGLDGEGDVFKVHGAFSDVVAALDDDETVGDEGRIGVGGIGSGIATRAVEVGVSRRLVHKDPTGQVN